MPSALGGNVYKLAWLGALLLVGLTSATASAHPLHLHDSLKAVNRRIAGQVIDHTHNHGRDRRIWSAALGKPRDLYVYVPPQFDPKRAYPFVLWLHGFAQDEKAFLDQVVEHVDKAIVCGELPPLIIAAPDGSVNGHECIMPTGSFFINSQAGNFEDYLMQDVWAFMHEHYPLRPEREANVIAGVSMGGFGAYNLAIKYQQRFKIVIGILPPLNMRWLDCHGRYMGNFDPHCWGWRTSLDRNFEVVGRFYGVVIIRMKHLVGPLYGRQPRDINFIIRENPAEMLEHYDLKEGVLSMYVGYGGQDQFNIDAQVESFLYIARCRGLTVTVGYDPDGKHDEATALRLFPGVVDWLRQQLAPYYATPP
jgi:hypothetical protein